jgi:methylmalonyl-CoA mutase cobalamin-binding subunit
MKRIQAAARALTPAQARLVIAALAEADEHKDGAAFFRGALEMRAGTRASGAPPKKKRARQ